MVAIMVNALYTAWRKRGTTRQLATSLVCCVASALLLLPAILWFNVRFSALQAAASTLEIALMLVYVSLWGLVAPFSATACFCLFTQPRDSNTSFRIPRSRSKRTTVGNAASIPAASGAGVLINLPHRLPGQPAPFVYGEDQPWGWIIHRNGRFQGQRLALKRNVITIGREDDNDIWLDDETSSRYHAELAWMNDQPYVTDCNSLNGILLNGRRMRGTLALAHGDFVEIGAHRFLFELAPRPVPLDDLDDPLLPHLRRPLSAASDMANLYNSEPLPIPDRRPANSPAFPTRPLSDPVTPPPLFAANQPYQSPQPPVLPQFPLPEQSTPPPMQPLFSLPSSSFQHETSLPPLPPGVCVIRTGVLVGNSFPLDRPQLIVGRMAGCDVRIDDPTLTIEYAQFQRLPAGDSVYGVGVLVNEMPLQSPRLLQPGDLIQLGAICLEYAPVTEVKTIPLSPPAMPSSPARTSSSPMHLRLPRKPK